MVRTYPVHTFLLARLSSQELTFLVNLQQSCFLSDKIATGCLHRNSNLFRANSTTLKILYKSFIYFWKLFSRTHLIPKWACSRPSGQRMTRKSSFRLLLIEFRKLPSARSLDFFLIPILKINTIYYIRSRRRPSNANFEIETKQIRNQRGSDMYQRVMAHPSVTTQQHFLSFKKVHTLFGCREKIQKNYNSIYVYDL